MVPQTESNDQPQHQICRPPRIRIMSAPVLTPEPDEHQQSDREDKVGRTALHRGPEMRIGGDQNDKHEEEQP